MNTYDSYDGRMIIREERKGAYVSLAVYEELEKRYEDMKNWVGYAKANPEPINWGFEQ